MAKRVLLTGANGLVGQHTLAAFLEAGHFVRSVVRSQSKVTQLSSIFSKYPASQMDFGIVPDITAPGAFDTVLKAEPPFDAVIHVASPFNYRTNTTNAEFLDPAIKGTTEILKGIARVAPTVKRVVMTSSMAAVINWTVPKIASPQKVYTEEDWNPVTWETATTTDVPNVIYQASKKFAELAAFDFVEKEKPNFDLAVLHPPMVYGPTYNASIFASVSELPESVYSVFDKTLAPGLSEASPLPPTRLHLYVDVRDLAQAHLRAATVPGAGGSRYILAAGEMSSQRILNIFRAALPQLSGRIPRGEPERWEMEEGSFAASNAKAREVLGLTFRSPEETMGDMARQLGELEKRLASSQ